MLRLLKLALGLALVAVVIWWLFRDADFAEILARMRDADLPLLALALIVGTTTYVVRAVRWRYLLWPVQPFQGEGGDRRPGGSFHSRFAAVCMGFMTNLLLPSGRVGEFLRAYAYGRMEAVPTSAAFATIVAERFLDGVAVVTLMFVAVYSPGFPSDTLPPVLATAIRTLAGVLGTGLAGSMLFVAFPARATAAFNAVALRALPARWADIAVRMADAFVTGFGALRDWRLLLPALAWSFGLWTVASLSMWIGFLAFGMHLPFASGLFANAAVAVAVFVPTPVPGYVGMWQAGAKVALVTVYGVAEAPVLAYAVGWQLVNYVPIVLLGLWYARRLGISWKDARK